MPSRPQRRRWQDVDKTNIRLSDLIRQFAMYHEDRNHSPKTVRWYSDMLGRLADSLGPEARLKDLTVDAIREYLRAARGNGLSKFTVHAYARTLKTFLRWLEREGLWGAKTPSVSGHCPDDLSGPASRRHVLLEVQPLGTVSSRRSGATISGGRLLEARRDGKRRIEYWHLTC